MAGGGNFTAKTQDVLSLGVRFDDLIQTFDEITLAMNVTAEKLLLFGRWDNINKALKLIEYVPPTTFLGKRELIYP